MGCDYRPNGQNGVNVKTEVLELQRSTYEAVLKARADVSAAKSVRARDLASRRLALLVDSWLHVTEARRVILGLPHPDKIPPDERKQRARHRTGEGIREPEEGKLDARGKKESLDAPEGGDGVGTGEGKPGGAVSERPPS